MNISTVSPQPSSAATGYAVAAVNQHATNGNTSNSAPTDNVVISDEARKKLAAETANDNGGGVEPPAPGSAATKADNGGGVEPPKTISTLSDNGGGIEPPKSPTTKPLGDNGGGVEPPRK